MADIAALREELLALREETRPLEPDHAARREMGGQVLDHALKFHDGIEQAPSYRPAAEAFSKRFNPEFTDAGRDLSEVLDFVGLTVDHSGIATSSPRFMGYIPGGGLFHSGLGDLLAATSNKYSGFASAGPGAVRIENACTRWLAEVVGYPDTASGTLTSGGSIANLSAVVAAREAADPDGGGVVYLTRFAHHCVDKALKIAGRGRSLRRYIATDADHRMDVATLDAAMAEDVANGLRPWLVVASAGTVDTGAIDPLPGIAAACRHHGAWFHVDGAYGGLFTLCDEGKRRLTGIEQADSIALDPHKTLFLPYGTGAVLVRNGQLLANAFGAEAAYIQPFGGADEVGPSPADLSPELTRHFRAMRLWLPLQLAGVDAFRSAQEEKLKLARYLHRRLAEFAAIDPGPEPQLSVVAFRHRDGNDASEKLLSQIVDQGKVMLSGTSIDGVSYLRAAILCFRTHVEHVDMVLDAVREGLE